MNDYESSRIDQQRKCCFFIMWELDWSGPCTYRSYIIIETVLDQIEYIEGQFLYKSNAYLNYLIKDLTPWSKFRHFYKFFGKKAFFPKRNTSWFLLPYHYRAIFSFIHYNFKIHFTIAKLQWSNLLIPNGKAYLKIHLRTQKVYILCSSIS